MNKKLLGFLTLLLLMFLKITNVNAEDYLLTRWDYDNIYFVQDDLPNYYMSGSQFHLLLNGKEAFCVDPEQKIKKSEYTGISLSETNYDANTINYLEKVMYYGYNYPNHQTDRYYIATQALIWEYVSSYKIDFYTQQYGYGDYIDISNEKNAILTLINEHNKVPFFANRHYNYGPVSNLQFEDELLNNYEIKSSSYSDVKIEQNKLKIDNLSDFTGTININLVRKTYINDEPKYYYAADSQSLITVGKPHELEIKLSISINGSKLKINKLDRESKLPIKDENIIFNIRNIETSKYVHINGEKDLHISKDGYIITPLLPYGTYEIIEIKTPEGYKLNKEERKVIIDNKIEDSIINVDIYNEREKGNIIIKKYGEIFNNDKFEYAFKELGGTKFELYANEDIVTLDGIKHYNKDELIMMLQTDENGLITFDNLILGSYYIKEKYTDDNYIKDEKKYYFNLYEKIDNKIEIYNY